MASSLAAACSSKPKPTQNRFRSASPNAPVDAATKRRVHDELALVEEPLDHDPLDGGDGAKARAGPLSRVLAQVDVRAAGLPHLRHERRQFRGPRWGFAEPERDGRGRAFRVGHTHHAGLDPQDPPRMRAQLHDIAALRFDGEVFVEGAQVRAVRLEQHLVVAGVRNGASGHQRGDACALGRP